MISWSATKGPLLVAWTGGTPARSTAAFEQVFVMIAAAGKPGALVGRVLDGWMGTHAIPLVDETVHATTRYLGALTVLQSEDLVAPSALPGWTRAHVVAHLSRNADAFTRVLGQAAAGEDATMYDSPESRDQDIDETVRTRDGGGLLEDAVQSSQRLERALGAYDGPPDATYTRVPGGTETFSVDTVGPRRLIEVEVHHADLLLEYRAADWPAAFSRDLIARRLDELGLDGPSMVLSSTDVDGLWKFGAGAGPEVTGTAGELAWWLVGRGGGAGLVSSTGELPQIARWR
jgi:maleylpyruvate isomerase